MSAVLLTYLPASHQDVHMAKMPSTYIPTTCVTSGAFPLESEHLAQDTLLPSFYSALEESRGDTRIAELRESIPAGTFFEKIQHWEAEQWTEKGLVRAVECRVGGDRSGIGR